MRYVTKDRRGRPARALAGSIAVGLIWIAAASAGAAPAAADTATVATVPVGDFPQGLAVAPDGTTLYVANGGGDSVTIVDTGTNAVTATISVGDGPSGVAFRHDSTRAYVANVNADSVSVLDTGAPAVVATVPVGNHPVAVAVAPHGIVSVANNVDNTISSIDGSTNAVVATEPVAQSPTSIALSSTGFIGYVTSLSTNSLSSYSAGTGWSFSGSIGVGSGPNAVVISPDGTRLYVANFLDDTVSVIATSGLSTVATVSVGSGPYSIAVSPDGARVYVPNHDDGTVSVIDTGTNAVVETVAVGAGPIAVAVSPVSGRVYVANAQDDTVSVLEDVAPTRTVTFEANAGSGTMAPQSANALTALSPNTFVRAGYAFAGWDTLAGGGGTAYADGADYDFVADLTLYAQWQPNEYVIAFDPGGGTGTMPDTAATVGTPVVLPPNAFGLPGSVFRGWALSPGGSVAFGDTASVEDLTLTEGATVTLYAVWRTPSVALGTAVAQPGERISIEGSGFGAGESVAIELHSTPVPLGTVVASPSGAFSTTVTIPAGTPAGTHAVVAIGLGGSAGVTVSATIAVSALATTGSDPTAQVLLAGGLLVAGALTLALRIGWRRAG